MTRAAGGGRGHWRVRRGRRLGAPDRRHRAALAHTALERELATLKQTEAGPSSSPPGTMPTPVCCPFWPGRTTSVFSDELNHASLIDGCRLSRAAVRVYRHCVMPAISIGSLHEADGFRRRLIVTETVFGMDGDLAPLADLVLVAQRRDAWIVVDEGPCDRRCLADTAADSSRSSG